jgi:hypothetical protein
MVTALVRYRIKGQHESFIPPQLGLTKPENDLQYVTAAKTLTGKP